MDHLSLGYVVLPSLELVFLDGLVDGLEQLGVKVAATVHTLQIVNEI